MTVLVLFVPVLVWASVHFRWFSVESFPGRVLYGAHDYLWLPLYGSLWTKYHPWSFCVLCFLGSVLVPLYLAWVFSWRPLRYLHRWSIRSLATTEWGAKWLPVGLQRVADAEMWVRRNPLFPQSAPTFLREAEARLREKLDRWPTMQPRFLLDIVGEQRTEALCRLQISGNYEHYDAATRLTGLESRVRCLSTAAPEDHWRAMAVWLEWDIVCARSCTASKRRLQREWQLKAPLDGDERTPLERFCERLQAIAGEREEQFAVSPFNPSVVAAAVLACLQTPGRIEAAALLALVAKFETALHQPPSLAKEELAALGSVICLFATAVAQRAARVSLAGGSALLGHHLGIVEELRWRAASPEVQGETETAWEAMWRDMPTPLICQVAHRLDASPRADFLLQEGSPWKETDFEFDARHRDALADAAGPPFLSHPGGQWNRDRGLESFHFRRLPQTSGDRKLHERLDLALAGGTVVALLALIFFWTGFVGFLDRLNRFDPRYSPDGKRPLADARILENVRRELLDKKILDATFHRTSGRASPRLFFSQQGGAFHIYDPQTRLWKTDRPTFPDLRQPEITRLQSSFSSKRRETLPLWGFSAGDGLVQFHRGAWSTVVSDTYFAHPDGTPVGGAELALAACAGKEGQPDWILYATTGGAGKPPALGLYRPATRHWSSFPPANQPLPFDLLRKLIWWKDAFRLGTNKGVFSLRPPAGAVLEPLKVLEGRDVLDLDVSLAGDLWVLDQNIPAGGALRLSRLTSEQDSESPWDEGTINPEVHLETLRYAFQDKGGPLYLGGEAGLLLYDPDRHSWQSQFAQPLTSFLAPPKLRGFYFGFEGGAGFVRSGKELKKMTFGSGKVARLKYADGRTYALTRPAGELFELGANAKPLYAPGSTAFDPATLHTALASEDQLLLVGPNGVLRHSVTDRSYADFAKGAVVPEWFCAYQPRLPLVESGPLIFGADGVEVVSMPKAEAFSGAFRGSKAVKGENSQEIQKMRAGRPGAVLTQERGGRCYEVTNNTRRSVLGPSIQNLGLDSISDAAESASRLFLSSTDWLVSYRTSDRAWEKAIPLPATELPAEIAADGDNLFVTTQSQRLLRLDTRKLDLPKPDLQNLFDTWIGAPAENDGEKRLSLVDGQLSDARLDGDRLFLAGKDENGKARLISYSLTERRVKDSWNRDAAESPIIAEIINGQPLFQAGDEAWLGGKRLEGAPADRIFGTSEQIWVERKEGTRRYLTGHNRTTGALESSLFRFPNAEPLGRDVHDGFVLRLESGATGEVLALAGQHGMRFYAPATRSWYQLPEQTSRDVPVPALVPAEAALLAGAAPNERFVFLADPPANGLTTLWFVPEKSFQFPLNSGEAIYNSNPQAVKVRAYSLDAESQSVVVVTEAGGVRRWERGEFARADEIPAPGEAPRSSELRHIYDATDPQKPQIVLLAVDRTGGLWRYRRARGPGAWPQSTMWTKIALEPATDDDSALALHATTGNWHATRTTRDRHGTTVQQALFNPREDNSISFTDAPLAQPVSGSFGGPAESLQDVVMTGDQPEDPWVFLGQRRISWFDPDQRDWPRTLEVPEATSPLKFLEIEKQFPLVIQEDGTRFWLPDQRSRLPSELRARERVGQQQAFVSTASNRDFGTVYLFSPDAPLQIQKLAANESSAIESFFETDPKHIERVWNWPDSDHYLFDSSTEGLRLYDRKNHREERPIRNEDGTQFYLQGASIVEAEGSLWAHFPPVGGADPLPRSPGLLVRLKNERNSDGLLSVRLWRWAGVDKFTLAGTAPRIRRDRRWERWMGEDFLPEKLPETKLGRWPANGNANAPARSSESGHLQPAENGFTSPIVLPEPKAVRAVVATPDGVWLFDEKTIQLYSEPGQAPWRQELPVALVSKTDDLWIDAVPGGLVVRAGNEGTRLTSTQNGIESVEATFRTPVAVTAISAAKVQNPAEHAEYRSDSLTITEMKTGLKFARPAGSPGVVSGTPPQLPLLGVYELHPPKKTAPSFYLRNQQGLTKVTLGNSEINFGLLLPCEDVRWGTDAEPAWLKIKGRWQPAPRGRASGFAQSSKLPEPPATPTLNAPAEVPDLWPQMSRERKLFAKRGESFVFNPIQKIAIDPQSGKLVASRPDGSKTDLQDGPFIALHELPDFARPLKEDWVSWDLGRQGFKLSNGFLAKTDAMSNGRFFFEETDALLPLFPTAKAHAPDRFASANSHGVLFFPVAPGLPPLSLRRTGIVFQKIRAFESLGPGALSTGHDHLLSPGRAWRFDRQAAAAPGKVEFSFNDLQIQHDLAKDEVKVSFARENGYDETAGFRWDMRSGLAVAGQQIWLATPLGVQDRATAENGYLSTYKTAGRLRSVYRRMPGAPDGKMGIYWQENTGRWHALSPADPKMKDDPRKNRLLVQDPGLSWRVTTDSQGAPDIAWRGRTLKGVTVDGQLSFPSDQLLGSTAHGNTLFAATNDGLDAAPGGALDLRQRTKEPRPLPGTFQDLHTLPAVTNLKARPAPVTFLTTRVGAQAQVIEKWNGATWQPASDTERDGPFRLADTGAWQDDTAGRIIVTGRWPRNQATATLEKKILLRPPGATASLQAVDFALGERFPWDTVHSLAQDGGKLFLGTDAGVEIHTLSQRNIGLDSGGTFLHLGGKATAPVKRIGLADTAEKPMLAEQGGRIFHLTPEGAAISKPLPATALETRLRVRREDLWLWTKTPQRAFGFYLRPNSATRTDVTLSKQGVFAHDELTDFACFEGKSFALWANGWVTVNTTPDLSLSRDSHPQNQPLPGGPSASPAVTVKLFDISHGPAVRERGIRSGIFAHVNDTNTLWAWEQKDWKKLSPGDRKNVEAEAKLRTIYQHGRWRMVIQQREQETPPAGASLLMEQRTILDEWLPIPWRSLGETALSRYAIDEWLDFEPWPSGAQGLAATPAGLLLVQTDGGKARLDPQRALILRDDSFTTPLTELELRLAQNGELHLRVDRKSDRVHTGFIEIKDALKEDAKFLTTSPTDPFATATYVRRQDSKLWGWELADDFDDSKGKSGARLKGEISLREEGTSEIRLAGGHFGFDRLKSIAFFQGDFMDLASDDGWIRAPRQRHLKLKELLRPHVAEVDPHEIKGVFPAADSGQTNPQSLALQRAGPSPADASAPSTSPTGGPATFLFDGKTAKVTAGSFEFQAFDGFWLHARPAEGPLEMWPRQSRNVSRRLEKGKFGDDTLRGFPIIASLPGGNAAYLVPTAAGVFGWNADHRPIIAAESKASARALFLDESEHPVLLHEDGAITSVDAQMKEQPTVRLAEWSPDSKILGVEPNSDGSHHVRYEVGGRRQSNRFQLTASALVSQQVNLLTHPLSGLVSWQRLRSRYALPFALDFALRPTALQIRDNHGIIQETTFSQQNDFRRMSILGETAIYTVADEVWEIDLKGSIRKSAKQTAR